jgi:hypothetical protein
MKIKLTRVYRAVPRHRVARGPSRGAYGRGEPAAPSPAPGSRGSRRIAGCGRVHGRTRGVSPASIDGEPGAAWAMGGQVLAAWVFTTDRGLIAGIDVIMDPGHLAELDVLLD